MIATTKSPATVRHATRILLVVSVALFLPMAATAGIVASSRALQPWEAIATDPNPVASIPELEDSATLEEIDAVLDRVIGEEGGIIMQRFKPQPDWLWKQWFGTVLYETSSMAFKNMALAFVFCVFTRYVTHGDLDIWAIPSSETMKSDPFGSRLVVVERIWQTLMSLTTFLLTFFVGQAYSFWRGFHDLGRGVQGRLNDIHMLMATHASRQNGAKRRSVYTPEASQFLTCLAQKLRIWHLLFWASNARRFRVLLTDTGLERMVSRGLLPRDEKERLCELDLPATQLHVAVLESALMACQDALRNKRIIKHSSTAVELVLLEQFGRLRGTCATIPDMVDGRMPLAYAHFVQILVDSFLMIAPIAQYTDLGIFSVVSMGILTVFYHGLLDLAKVFLDPLDNEDYCEGCVYLDLAVLIREANAGSTRWMKGASSV